MSRHHPGPQHQPSSSQSISQKSICLHTPHTPSDPGTSKLIPTREPGQVIRLRSAKEVRELAEAKDGSQASLGQLCSVKFPPARSLHLHANSCMCLYCVELALVLRFKALGQAPLLTLAAPVTAYRVLGEQLHHSLSSFPQLYNGDHARILLMGLLQD